MPVMDSVKDKQVKEWMDSNLPDLKQNKLSEEDYNKALKEFIILFEGSRDKAYDDKVPKEGHPNGLKTVGVGFNMDQDRAEEIWNRAFKEAHIPAPAFDDVYSGNTKLTSKEIDALLDYTIIDKRDELTRAYGEYIWNKIPQNAKLAIEDAYFNGPGLVRGGTRFQQYIDYYVRDHSFRGLQLAIFELQFQGNKTGIAGIGVRRDVQAAVLIGFGKSYIDFKNNFIGMSEFQQKINNKTFTFQDFEKFQIVYSKEFMSNYLSQYEDQFKNHSLFDHVKAYATPMMIYTIDFMFDKFYKHRKIFDLGWIASHGIPAYIMNWPNKGNEYWKVNCSIDDYLKHCAVFRKEISNIYNNDMYLLHKEYHEHSPSNHNGSNDSKQKDNSWHHKPSNQDSNDYVYIHINNPNDKCDPNGDSDCYR